MPRFTPIIRLLLTAVAAGVAVTVSIVDIPTYLTGIVVGFNVFFAGLGIIPPQVSAHTVISPSTKDIVASEPKV
jgi:hypothetical protein